VVIDAGHVQVAAKRWRLKGYSAPRIDGARCTAERVRGVEARERLEKLLTSARAEIAVYPEGRIDRWLGIARLTVDGADLGPILIAEQYAVKEGERELWGCPKPEAKQKPAPKAPQPVAVVKEKTLVIKEKTVVVVVKEPSSATSAPKSDKLSSTASAPKSDKSNCTWVRGYTRGDGTEVKAHQRCKKTH
jgi:hypothetical protein